MILFICLDEYVIFTNKNCIFSKMFRTIDNLWRKNDILKSGSKSSIQTNSNILLKYMVISYQYEHTNCCNPSYFIRTDVNKTGIVVDGNFMTVICAYLINFALTNYLVSKFTCWCKFMNWKKKFWKISSRTEELRSCHIDDTVDAIVQCTEEVTRENVVRRSYYFFN